MCTRVVVLGAHHGVWARTADPCRADVAQRAGIAIIAARPILGRHTQAEAIGGVASVFSAWVAVFAAGGVEATTEVGLTALCTEVET